MRYYNRLTLTTLGFLVSLTACGYANPSLQEPGIQTDIIHEDIKPEINNQEPAPTFGNEDVAFPVGKIKLVSDEVKIRDYSKIISKYENREVTLTELDELSRIITKRLRNNGYPVASIYVPQQTFAKGGDLILKVAPGRYGKITFDNGSKLPSDIAEGYFKGLKEGMIITNRNLDTAMYKLTSVGGIKATGTLLPGKEFGTADLNVTIRNGKSHTEILYAENYGAQYAGRYRYGLQGFITDPNVAGEFNYAFVMSNSNQHNYAVGWNQFVGRSGTKLGVHVTRGDYELGGIYSALGVRGKSLTYSINGSTPIFHTWRDNLNIQYGYNHRVLHDEQNSFDLDLKKHSDSFYVGLNGLSRRGKAIFNYNLVNTTGVLNFDNDYARIIYGPSDTKGSYNKTNFFANYQQTFNKYFDMQLRFSGQIATSNLDGSEEITLGGINGVRAYPTSAGSGDEGYVATAELRYHSKVPGLIFSLYIDTGHVKTTHDSGHALYGGETATGWGIGVSYVKPGDFFARFDYARRIGYGLNEAADESAKAKSRMWFMLGKVF